MKVRCTCGREHEEGTIIATGNRAHQILRTAVSPVPPAVRVQGKRYRLKAVTDPDEGVSRGGTWQCLGTTLYDKGLIRYRSAGKEISPDEEADTILHEVLHVIWASSGLKPGEKHREERVVQRMVPLLLDTLRQNPDLIAYLLSEGGDAHAQEETQAQTEAP